MSSSSCTLVERATEVSALRDALTAAGEGRGGTVQLSGHAGVGKSALAAHTQDLARELGFTVLQACATPVSTTLPHGLVRDWLGPLARRTGPGSRPFDGPARALAEALTGLDPDHHAWALGTLDYALSWVWEGLLEAGPLLLVVDDVQWLDTGSLAVLDLLSARIADSPTVLLLARRTGEPTGHGDVLDRIGRRATVLEPQPLSVVGVEQLRRQLPATPGMAGVSSHEVHRVSGGLPFLVRELLRGGARGVHEPPRPVVDSVRERLARLGPTVLEVARTVAVLGEEAEFDTVGELCGLTVADLADPLEVLTDADVVTLGLWRAWPAHPLVREAILASLTPSERSARHRRAAAHLAKLGRSPQVVAGHLLHTLPGGDHDVVVLLRTAAVESLRAGTPEVAAAQLLRAVGETTPEDTDPELFAVAARAHLRADLTEQAFDLWRRALDRLVAPEARAEVLADVAEAQMTVGDRDAARSSYERARELLADAGHDGSSPAMRLLLGRMGMARTMHDGTQVVLADTLASAWAQPRTRDGHADRVLFALGAMRLAVEGRDHTTARALALRAEGDGALLAEEGVDGSGFHLAMGVLTWTDAFPTVFRALEAAIEESRRSGSALSFAQASYGRGFAHYRRGNLRAAVADLDTALSLRARGWDRYTSSARSALAYVHVGLGQLDQALALEPALRDHARAQDLAGAAALTTAGIIRASHGDHAAALEDYRAVARIMARTAPDGVAIEWRELTAWTLLRLGRRAEAKAMASQALAAARRWGSPRSLGFSLRTLSHMVPRDAAVPLLRESVYLLESCDAVDYLARSRVDLAALLLRARSTRAEGVELLQQARAYAVRTEVTPLVEQTTELLLRHGVPVTAEPGSALQLLTAGERRVVELAAAGHTNREIAQQLFVTVKAVEWHLSNAYRKLAVSGRAQLPAALAGQPGSDPSSSSDR